MVKEELLDSIYQLMSVRGLRANRLYHLMSVKGIPAKSSYLLKKSPSLRSG